MGVLPELPTGPTVEVHAGVLERVVLVEQLGTERADALGRVVEGAHRADPARSVGNHVRVEQQQARPGGDLDAEVVGAGKARSRGQVDDPKGDSVETEQLARLLGEFIRLLRGVQHVDEVRLDQLRVPRELQHLVLDEVEALVERHDDRDRRVRWRLAVDIDGVNARLVDDPLLQARQRVAAVVRGERSADRAAMA